MPNTEIKYCLPAFDWQLKMNVPLCIFQKKSLLSIWHLIQNWKEKKFGLHVIFKEYQYTNTI